MEVARNSPKTQTPTKVRNVVVEDPRYAEYAAYIGTAGVTITDDGLPKKISLEEFSRLLGLDRKTLYNWSQRPDFPVLVEKKRQEIFSVRSVSATWSAIRLKSMKGDVEAAKLFLGAFANWQPPAQRKEVVVSGSWADLVDARREVIEAEVVDGEPEDS